MKEIPGKKIKELEFFSGQFYRDSKREIKYDLELRKTIVIENTTIEANLEIGVVGVNIHYSFPNFCYSA